MKRLSAVISCVILLFALVSFGATLSNPFDRIEQLVKVHGNDLGNGGCSGYVIDKPGIRYVLVACSSDRSVGILKVSLQTMEGKGVSFNRSNNHFQYFTFEDGEVTDVVEIDKESAFTLANRYLNEATESNQMSI